MANVAKPFASSQPASNANSGTAQRVYGGSSGNACWKSRIVISPRYWSSCDDGDTKADHD